MGFIGWGLIFGVGNFGVILGCVVLVEKVCMVLEKSLK